MLDQGTILEKLKQGAKTYLRPLHCRSLTSGRSDSEFELSLRLSATEVEAFLCTQSELQKILALPLPCSRLRGQLENCLSPVTSWASLDLSHPTIMGIVNVTPDSFSDGGDFAAAQTAVDHGIKLSSEGAAILDVGGESTRPGASKPTEAEEIKRVKSVVSQLSALGYLVSIDTRRTKVMKAAVNAGALIIDDVSALLGDDQSLDYVATSQLPVVLMHMQGTPETMQEAPSYNNVVLDVYDFLEQRIQCCLDAGLPREKIAIDPGIGFGKTIDHNLSLINNLSTFQGLGCAILMGLSRKGFIGKLGDAGEAKDRIPGTIAANLESIRQGANILRVHDVKENLQAWKILNALESNSF